MVARHAHADLHAGKPGHGSRSLWRPISRRMPHVLSCTPAREYGGRVSSDGRWLAYFSNETGAFDLYLRPLARNAPRTGLTTNERALARAREAVWSRDGRELFYRHGSQMMSVRVPADEQRPPESATVLFEGDYFATGGPGISTTTSRPIGDF